MSATAFQRMRREALAKKQGKKEDEVVKELKVSELKALLDEKGIDYDSKAKKEDLLKLLEGAE